MVTEIDPICRRHGGLPGDYDRRGCLNQVLAQIELFTNLRIPMMSAGHFD